MDFIREIGEWNNWGLPSPNYSDFVLRSFGDVV
jgi:hypothetical protein